MTSAKEKRQKQLEQSIRKNPFLKDEELARAFGVSVATIRIDRAELGIAQYRERVKNAAERGFENPANAEVLELNLYKDGILVFDTDAGMTFEGTDIVKSQHIYSYAENLALDVVDAKAALVKVANVKYIEEVRAGERLIVHSEVVRVREREYIVHVKIRSKSREVFRGKFSLAELEV